MKKLMVIVASLLLVASTAVAADWNFYGSARITTFVSDIDVPGGNDTTSLNHNIQSNARIGARVKVNDAVGGRFEYGSTPNLRILYGTWNFGAGQLLVGQGYTPAMTLYSNQVFGDDTDLVGFGTIYAGRQPMVRLKFGDFKIAAVQPETSDLGSGGFTEVTFPKIEASYDLNLGAVKLALVGGFNTYELTVAGVEHDVDSYVIGVGAQVGMGAFYAKGDIYLGENITPYGIASSVVAAPALSGTTLQDNDAYGFYFLVGAKLNDMFSFEAGYGYMEAELDGAASNEDDAEAYYVQSTITFAPGVFIVPEIGVIDNKQDAFGAEESETVYYGLKWQINF